MELLIILGLVLGVAGAAVWVRRTFRHEIDRGRRIRRSRRKP